MIRRKERDIRMLLSIEFSFATSARLILAVVVASQTCAGSPTFAVPASEKTVELAVFIDQYLYHYWIRTLQLSTPVSPASIQTFIRSYIDVLLYSLNLIYAHPSLGSSGSLLRRSSSLFSRKDDGTGGEEGFVPLIGFHLSHAQFFWRGDPTNLHPDLRESAPDYLDSFCDFARKENSRSGRARWDHALLLTGVDLKFPNGKNYGVAGISWDNSMCNKTYSCSVVEGKTFRSVMTAAHEIGHSLGIEHDGLKYNFKCSSSGYIMSHAGGGEESVGKIAWSPCSKHNLRAFLNTAPNVLRNQVECLNDDPRTGRTGNWKQRDRKGRGEVGEGLPGRTFSPEQQCHLGGGVHWKPSISTRHIKVKICSMLYCNNTRTGQLIPFHPALEGTPCGNDKVCKYGECIPFSDFHMAASFGPRKSNWTTENMKSSDSDNIATKIVRSLMVSAKEKLSFSISPLLFFA